MAGTQTAGYVHNIYNLSFELTWQPSWLIHLVCTYSRSLSLSPAWYDRADNPALWRLSAMASQSLRDRQYTMPESPASEQQTDAYNPRQNTDLKELRDFISIKNNIQQLDIIKFYTVIHLACCLQTVLISHLLFQTCEGLKCSYTVKNLTQQLWQCSENSMHRDQRKYWIIYVGSASWSSWCSPHPPFWVSWAALSTSGLFCWSSS